MKAIEGFIVRCGGKGGKELMSSGIDTERFIHEEALRTILTPTLTRASYPMSAIHGILILQFAKRPGPNGVHCLLDR